MVISDGGVKGGDMLGRVILEGEERDCKGDYGLELVG